MDRFFFFWKRCWGFQFGLKISRCRGKQHTIHCRLCPYGLFEARVEPCFGTRVLPIMFTHFTCQVHQVSPSLQNVTQCFYFLLDVNFPLTDYWFYSMRIIHLVTLYTPVTFLCDILMAIMLSVDMILVRITSSLTSYKNKRVCSLLQAAKRFTNHLTTFRTYF